MYPFKMLIFNNLFAWLRLLKYIVFDNFYIKCVKKDKEKLKFSLFKKIKTRLLVKKLRQKN